jgi:uncharacterized Fe-S center protein
MIKCFVLFIFIFESFQKASDVYFTTDINPSSIVKLFKKLNIELKGRVALKVHSGEIGGKYFLHPDFLEEIYNFTNGTFIESNAAYEGGRHTTELHKLLLKDHGWLDKGRRTIILDEDSKKDFELEVENPAMIKENIVGGNLKNFNSCIVLSHFKGHSMGGYGGALKQLSIGFASQAGKTWIHTAGNITDWELMDFFEANQANFTASMADAASSIVQYFRNRGGIAFINVLANISLECDCAGGDAPKPRIHDMGIFASIDPVAIDRACLDMIAEHQDIGTEDFFEQLTNLTGENTIYVAENHKIGSQKYNLININIEEGEDNNYILLIIILSLVAFILILAIIPGFYFYKKYKSSKNNEEKGISLVQKKE